MNTCPSCNGRKGSVGIYCGTGPSYSKWSECRLCGGSGTVDDEVARRYSISRAFRNFRVEHGAGQKQTAESLGVDYVAYSKWESGYGPLWDKGWNPSTS